jgi:hypothetical protein
MLTRKLDCCGYIVVTGSAAHLETVDLAFVDNIDYLADRHKNRGSRTRNCAERFPMDLLHKTRGSSQWNLYQAL